MPIEYEIPKSYPYEGNGIEQAKKLMGDLDLRPFVEDTNMPPKLFSENGRHIRARFTGNYVVLRGPLKVLVDVFLPEEEPPRFALELVTVPEGKSVRTETPKMKDIHIFSKATRNRLKWATIGGSVAGAGGAGAGQVTIERPEIGAVTAVGGVIAGWLWEGSKYAEYSQEPVEL